MNLNEKIENLIINYKKYFIVFSFVFIFFLSSLIFYTLFLAFEMKKLSADIKFLISCDMDSFERFLRISDDVNKKLLQGDARKRDVFLFIDFPRKESVSYIKSKIYSLTKYFGVPVVFLRRNDNSSLGITCMIEIENNDKLYLIKKFIFKDLYLKKMKIRYN